MELIIQTISGMDSLTAALTAFTFLWTITLIIIHARLYKQNDIMTVWKILCLVPLALCVPHYIFQGFFAGMPDGLILTLYYYGTLYLGAAVVALWQFFAYRKHGHRITAVITVIAVTLTSLMTCMGGMNNVDNFSTLDYESSFRALISALKEKYVLEEWKRIDFDALESELLPEVTKAQEENDPAGYMTALYKLQYSMYDYHVEVSTNDFKVYSEASDRLLGDDHGLSMFTLSDGRTIAVMVDEESDAYKFGIRNGTVISKWNGTDIETAKKELKCIIPFGSFPVEENEEMFKAAFLAGTGGENVRITFVGDMGGEITVTVGSTGPYTERFRDAYAKFAHIDAAELDNFTAKMISDDCGYLVISSESYNTLLDIKAIITGEYPEMTKLIGEKLDKLKAKGMKKLIIDTRNNSGGFDEISGAAASFFTDEKLYINGMGIYDNGSYEPIYKHYLDPVGTYKDIPVVVITNFCCSSAGDGLVYDLSRCPNVTVMGMTHSSGVNQFTGGAAVTSGSEFIFSYPSSPSLDENGKIFIDTKADRVSRNPVDVKIPLTAEAAEIIFSESGRDYELEYALDYINRLN